LIAHRGSVALLVFLLLDPRLFDPGVRPDPRTLGVLESGIATVLTANRTTICPRGLSQNPDTSQPAYHREPPTAPLPSTLDPAQFADNKAAFVAYALAAKLRAVLYQEPCYCGCNQVIGHESLLDCYTGRHGVDCPKCQAEVFFLYEQAKIGKSAAQMRKAMENGDARKVEIDKYADAHYDELKRATP
jgi:hypothetical protein